MDKHLGPEAVRRQDEQDPNDFILWYNLVQYNFFYLVNLTLFVTEGGGFNPSVNFIRPLTSFGSPIRNVIATSNGLNTVTNATTNTYNVALAVGFQLDGL